MPIYEFVCQSCGHEFERILSFSDTSTPACGNCQSEQVVRRVGRPAIHFKGSGWYITDSKKSSESRTGTNGHSKESSSEKDSAGSSSDGPSGEKSSEKSSETKNVAASEPVKAAAD